VGSNHTGRMDFCLWCCQVESVRRADHPSRGVLPSVMSEYDPEASIMRRPWPTGGCCAMKKKNDVIRVITDRYNKELLQYTLTNKYSSTHVKHDHKITPDDFT